VTKIEVFTTALKKLYAVCYRTKLIN